MDRAAGGHGRTGGCRLSDVMIVLPFIRNYASLTNRTFYHYKG